MKNISHIYHYFSLKKTDLKQAKLEICFDQASFALHNMQSAIREIKPVNFRDAWQLDDHIIGS